MAESPYDERKTEEESTDCCCAGHGSGEKECARNLRAWSTEIEEKNEENAGTCGVLNQMELETDEADHTTKQDSVSVGSGRPVQKPAETSKT